MKPGPKPMFRPELLAPAGDWAALRAAAANGADAVYFGLRDFNARLRAANFGVEELPKVVAWLHDHNVRGYVTVNTLVFPDELPTAAERLAAIAEAGADAVIVQDLGLVPLARRLAPSLPVHASTQMTLSDARGIELVRSLGIRRVILARELSLDEIRRVAAALSAYPPAGIGTCGREAPVELEVFVHGALCISFSGQCSASLAMGGRSANRGLCAQPCRLPYQLVAEGKPVPLGSCRHPLSPQDLAAYDCLPELLAAGVRGFKIEGRLKGADYVAAAVRTYRAALDAALAGEAFALSREQEAELAQGFSRGFTPGYLGGASHRELVVGRSPKGRGLRLGEVVGKAPRGIVVALAEGQPSVKPGDGVVFEDADAEDEEQGGRVMAVEPVPGRADRVLLAFRRGDVRPDAVPIGSAVWKTDDPEVRQRLEQSYARDRIFRAEPVAVRVRAALGEPLRIAVSDAAGHSATVAWDRPLERAERHPLSLEVLREQLGRLGGTPFELGSLDADPLDPVMVPKSVLNDLRRQAVDALRQQREAAARHPIAEPDALVALRARPSPFGRGEGEGPGERSGASFPAPSPRPSPEGRGGEDGRGAEARLSILVRSLEQLDAVLALPASAAGPAMVYCDLREPGETQEAVRRVRAAGLPVGLATLRIVKPGDADSLRALADAAPDAVLVRNLSALAFFRERTPRPILVGDFSLNAANDLAAHLLLSLGLDRLTPGLDVALRQAQGGVSLPNAAGAQLDALLRRVSPGRIEVILHQHVPMFHMQHCLFAARLSRGHDRSDCGKPCRREVALRDRKGESHPVLADAACRNTVFQATARSASAGEVRRLWQLGVRHFRVELLGETAPEARALLDRCSRLLARAGA